MIRHRTKKNHRNGERGVTLLIVVVAMLSMLAMVALAIDVITLYAARSETQSAADSAALAAAKMLVDSGVTADPGNASVNTTARTMATRVARDVAQRAIIAGRPVQSGDVSVTFPNSAAPSFGINPRVHVTVENANLPTFFSRIWNRNALTVRASATAEAFNPSNSGSLTGGVGLPVIAHGVKPFILPNCDPDTTRTGTLCSGRASIIDPVTGAITSPGQTAAGIIGETFTLTSACTNSTGSYCTLPASSTAGSYYPAAIPIPLGGNQCPQGCTGGPTFEQNIYCSNPTALQCGSSLNLDLTMLPDKGPGPARAGVRCLIHQSPGNGQDILNQNAPRPLSYPLQIQVGDNNPLEGTTVAANDFVTTSDSIVTLPIYDGSAVAGPVTIRGFLQVFINESNGNGSFDVTVLNVAGCGTGATGTPVSGGGVTTPAVRLVQ
jgi:hypothetical protein